MTRRGDRVGELAHASVPDLKESVGGLRDATVLKALVATWLVDVSHADLEPQPAAAPRRARRAARRGRAGHRPGRPRDLAGPRRGARPRRRRGRTAPGPRGRPAHHPPVPADLAAGRRGARAPARPPAAAPRSSSASAPGWRSRAARWSSTGAPTPAGTRTCCSGPPPRRPSGGWCSARPPHRGWDGRAPRCRNPGGGRRATCSPGCWPPAPACSRSGRPSTRRVRWSQLLPEWERVRLLPHASVVHRFTVDRHLVETCIEASRLIRRVSRPDVLMTAALLHDLGKGQLVDHSVAGEPLAAGTAARMGFDEREVALVRRPGPLAPAARRGRHHPRPRGPGHRGVRRRADPRRRDARPARGAHRGGRPGDLAPGVDGLAGGAGRGPRPPGPARAVRHLPRARAPSTPRSTSRCRPPSRADPRRVDVRLETRGGRGHRDRGVGGPDRA